MNNIATDNSSDVTSITPPVVNDFDDGESHCPSCGNQIYGGYCEDCDELHLGY